MPALARTRLNGRGASPGRAAGPVARLNFGTTRTPLAGDLTDAFAVAARQLGSLARRADCLDFQLALLEDEALTAPLRADIGKGAPAALAWRRATGALIADFEASDSELVRARALDVADLRDRVLQALAPERAPPPPPGAIVVADDLPPSRFLEIDWSKGGGVALARGSAMSHTAILARAQGVPMLVQLGEVPPAERALIDGDNGVLVLDPPPGEAEPTSPLPPPRPAQALTYRGEPVRLWLNIEGPESLNHPAAALADGVGLLRTEFLLRDRDDARDESRQTQAYAQVLHWAAGRPVIIRTLDLGADKSFGPETPRSPLGLRGLRLSLREPDLFAPQLRALCRAAALGPLKAMFPFVTTPQEYAAALALASQALADLQRAGTPARLPEFGMMVETPAAALTLADFPASFFSIGSNDLAQFTLACDRADGEVADLYDPLHPAVVQLIERIVAEGRRSGREVNLCGDVAADPRRTKTLLDLGLRRLSMSPGALPAVLAAEPRP